MNKKQNPSKLNKAFLLFSLMICMLVVFCMNGMHVQAKEQNAFFIDAELIGDNADTYDIQVTVENPGKDFEGTVRLVMTDNYRISTAFDTKLSLPEGSVKQFVVKIPKLSIESTSGTINIYMLDKKDKIVWEEVFYHLLTDGRMAVHLGVLSDQYKKLTYLDMNGNKIYFQGDEYPVKLYEIDQTNLLDKLDNLQLLVIDTYDTSVLTQEEIEAIAKWCDDGGMLIIGTGEYAEATLSTFSEQFVDIECLGINEPGSSGSFYQYNDMLNWDALYMADLRELTSGHNYNVMYNTAALCYSQGNGAIMVLPYSLEEMEWQGESFYGDSYLDRTEMVREILQDAANMAVSGNYSDYNDKYYNIPSHIRAMLRGIGAANSKLDFTVLKWIVVFYVIFAGPILYLILKAMKKREYYWGAVAVTVAVAMAFVYLIGQGHEVRNTRVFSVTTENLDDVDKSMTFLYGYDASHDEWLIKMKEGYEYGGKLGDLTYRYSDEEGAYDSRVLKEGDRLSIGIVPEENFQNAYLMLGCSKDAEATEGSIDGESIYEDQGILYGTITNNTEYDFTYYAVIIDQQLFLLKGLDAGESLNLSAQTILRHETDGDRFYGQYENYVYREYRQNTKAREEIAAMSAIGVGVYSSCLEHEGDKIVLIGLLSECEETVDDDVNEMAFKCVYQIQ